MKSITYVYSGGRSENYFKDNILAKDFYYGITEFDKEKYKINIIEFQKKVDSLMSSSNFLTS